MTATIKQRCLKAQDVDLAIWSSFVAFVPYSLCSGVKTELESYATGVC